MSRKHRSRSKYAGDGGKYHPGVKSLISEGNWTSVRVLAAYARAVGDFDHFAHMSDARLASTLLDLRDEGLITLGYDEAEESVFIRLNIPEGVTHDGPGAS